MSFFIMVLLQFGRWIYTYRHST